MSEKAFSFYGVSTPVLILLLFAGMLVVLKIGAIIGDKLRNKVDEKNASINTTIVGSVLALFAFLLGFTFSMSASLYDVRRTNNITEANSISTALSRVDLYPVPERAYFRSDFKDYTISRISYFQAGSDMETMKKAEKNAQDYASRIWKRASVDAVNTESLFPANLMIPALNEMMDNANSNNYGEKFKVPDPIIFLLLAISLVSAFFVGYYTVNKDKFNALMNIGFCVLSCVVIFITLDLGSSRTGFIKHPTSLEALNDVLRQFDHP
ncbi:MAG: hypothetical protein ACJ75B_15500 [Flavisolibacter sp.]